MSQKKRLYAIKSICKDHVKKNLESMKRELEILKLADHPNIVKLYEIYEDTKYIHLVMEYCSGGDLCDYLIQKEVLTEKEVSALMKQIFSAVNHLHSLKICHRDIKPENFLLANSIGEPEVKLTDFGMSVKFGDDKMKSMVGTPYFVAPEVLKGRYGKECDIWSAGVLMYFMLSGKHPFKGVDLKDLFLRIVKGEFSFPEKPWSHISKEAKLLIQQTLVPNPAKRISINRALGHPWFKTLDDPAEHPPINLEIFSALKKFKAPGKLWQEAMKVFVRNISEEKYEELGAMFKEIDQSNTGFVTAQDIVDAMRRNGYEILGEEIEALMRNIEYIGHGKLNYTQFLIAALARKRVLDDEAMWAVFNHFDITHSGTISLDNLKFALEKAGCFISEADFEEIVNEFELKAGKDMDYEEFKEIMTCFSEEHSFVILTEEDEARVNERRQTKRLSMKRMTIRRATMKENQQLIENKMEIYKEVSGDTKVIEN
eukprot:CAMPEP_0202955304 /NCGR_PEP_ID=MMETSP1395-20130829/51696_1 /ASSEMBLY_ACC=CAM_ASM_000871 /TAXON_ID=5961 /ORGANISM="Blepharisma japonicum, Strain Stock R1072" /LENGTH=484 /DNA_ID=CAMNT_0049671735 /DNA_START=196 /DNA_END=1650 /DNA_ORIENTATION=+